MNKSFERMDSNVVDNIDHVAGQPGHQTYLFQAIVELFAGGNDRMIFERKLYHIAYSWYELIFLDLVFFFFLSLKLQV